ncbi:ALS2 C-terminal-like protein isoform X1 [Acipenser ruthenus]|uniref:ALS2 C-terminal-like protein isoform X1 n=1 Tax=Acipenser ruthenus TaxID=7906 RepID=UPI00145A0FCC|nr:ALS2 C-terminal-like protein isoform X1 [Acipenser ruthenus]XP_058878942.1 ALS2 C-terminal-like protein isoform X1 [Acipenser ruthenus]
MKIAGNIGVLLPVLMSHPGSSSQRSTSFSIPFSSSPPDPAGSHFKEKSAARSLVETDKTFLDSLADINTNVLHHLLHHNTVDQKWHSQMTQLLVLNEKFHALWDQTGEMCKTLKRLIQQDKPVSLQDIYIISNKTGVQEVYIQYFSSFTNFLVVEGFDYLSKKTSCYFKKNKVNLNKFLTNSQKAENSVSVSLYRILHERIRDQVNQYTLILTRLYETTHKTASSEVIRDALKGFVDLQMYINQVLDEASGTNALWKSLERKVTDVLRIPERRLREESRNIPISVSPGRSGHDRILLFDDVFVLLQGSDIHCYDLTSLWIEFTTEENPSRRSLKVTSPEESFTLSAKEPQHEAVWQWKLNQAIRQCLAGKRDFPLWGKGVNGRSPSSPPISRFSAYTFKNEGRFKNAVYEGHWNKGVPHGKGTLRWDDERNYTGDFRDGKEHGFGVCVVPRKETEGYDCYKCHWKDGRMHGYGICEYSNNTVYRGYFKDNLRHGFGILEGCRTDSKPLRYVGHWENDKKTGYGVWESIDSGESYRGMWLEDQRHGHGIVVTQSGLCYKGIFNSDKLTGKGILLSEDNSLYEGEFTEDLMLKGKGKLTFPNGFTIEGVFSNTFGNGLQASGILKTVGHEETAESVAQLQMGLHGLPVEKRWTGIYEPFVEYLQAGSTEESDESFLGFHIETGRTMRKTPNNNNGAGIIAETHTEVTTEYLFCNREPEEFSVSTDFIENLKKQPDYILLQQYLEKSFQSSKHPLGKILQTQALVFQATYSGMGANKHLLTMAQEEVKYHAKKLLEIIRDYLPESFNKECEDKETMDEMNCYTVVLPLILPKFYPELFMLYMLYHEQGDALYWQGIVHLGLLSDAKLLEFLDVQKHLWPLKDLQLTANQRYSQVKDQCFHSAIECFQKISTTADPRDKIDTLFRTFEEIEKTVSWVLDREYKLPMDDLLPLLIYVVSRARIQHLGAELHLIRDMMDPCGIGGIYDFLLTALESCYQHIQKEDIRQARFPD